MWTGSLCDPDDALYRFRMLLCDEERARADRFRTPPLRRRFIVARALLRCLLSVYVSAPPASLRIGYGPHGKPALQDGSGVCFNLSHAEDVAVIAVAREREIGIDIVDQRADVDCDGIARLAFSPAEREALGALEAGDRRDAFFRIWARKEAYIKAHGAGLSYPTRAFSVSHRAGNSDALLDDENGPGSALRWRIAEIGAPDGFHCALAAQGWDGSILRVDPSLIDPLPLAHAHGHEDPGAVTLDQ